MSETENEATHTWLACCPTCGDVQGASVDDGSERVQTFVREHLLAGYRVERQPRAEARERVVVGFNACGHPLVAHEGGEEPVALRGRMLLTVRPDLFAFMPTPRVVAKRGRVYPITMNRYGAACAVMPDGQRLGLKPDEFDWTDEPVTAAPAEEPPMSNPPSSPSADALEAAKQDARVLALRVWVDSPHAANCTRETPERCDCHRDTARRVLEAAPREARGWMVPNPQYPDRGYWLCALHKQPVHGGEESVYRTCPGCDALDAALSTPGDANGQ